jgi:hypothetical protein
MARYKQSTRLRSWSSSVAVSVYPPATIDFVNLVTALRQDTKPRRKTRYNRGSSPAAEAIPSGWKESPLGVVPGYPAGCSRSGVCPRERMERKPPARQDPGIRPERPGHEGCRAKHRRVHRVIAGLGLMIYSSVRLFTVIFETCVLGLLDGSVRSSSAESDHQVIRGMQSRRGWWKDLRILHVRGRQQLFISR